MKFVPTEGHILITPDEKEEKTSSGILVGKDALEDKNTGIVFASSGKIPIGTRVVFRYGFDNVFVNGKDYLYGKETDLIGYYVD